MAQTPMPTPAEIEAYHLAWRKVDRCILGRTPKTQAAVDALIVEVGPEIVQEAANLTWQKVHRLKSLEHPIPYLISTAKGIKAEGGLHSQAVPTLYDVRKKIAIGQHCSPKLAALEDEMQPKTRRRPRNARKHA